MGKRAAFQVQVPLALSRRPSIKFEIGFPVWQLDSSIVASPWNVSSWGQMGEPSPPFLLGPGDSCKLSTVRVIRTKM